jgi:hypothetical protein
MVIEKNIDEMTMEEYVQYESDMAIKNGWVYDWRYARYEEEKWYLNDDDTDYTGFEEEEYPAIAYNKDEDDVYAELNIDECPAIFSPLDLLFPFVSQPSEEEKHDLETIEQQLDDLDRDNSLQGNQDIDDKRFNVIVHKDVPYLDTLLSLNLQPPDYDISNSEV